MLGKVNFFSKVLEPRGSGPCIRGPYLTRIPNLEDLQPVFSERETSHSPTNRVAVWRTRSPFVDLLTPKGGRRVTKLFRPFEGTVTIRKWRTRGNRSFLSRVHEHTMVNAFKKFESGIFLEVCKHAQIRQRSQGDTPERSTESAGRSKELFSDVTNRPKGALARASGTRACTPSRFQAKTPTTKNGPEMDK